MNQVAQQGFSNAAGVYEQARPSYPSEVIDFIKTLCEKPDVVVDLGAGTGKLTRLLGPLGARELIAIEPVAAMRENLKQFPIITKIIDGTAEQIPLADHTVDIIVCAQSFHWFANHRSLAEFHRVLKPNGHLILIWNVGNDGGTPWKDRLLAYVESFRPAEQADIKEMKWKDAFENQNFFSTMEHKEFINPLKITRELGIKLILSTSFIAALPTEKQTEIAENLRKMLDDVEEIRGTDQFDAQITTNVYWCSPLP